ncbi:hypothetical protein [Peribacillus asahii]|uniref:hypothetical protein n=1 Tax=Peribacillus asahii TaxID=228899 RepID=UPI00207A1C40|nr:hypothetical protein [Peribacillus asahii]USK71773.1 hypothetical protein LIS76_08470 [Peribacillus asahii]
MLKEMLNKLTDALAKSETSTIGKIFIVFNQQYEDIKGTLKTMEEWIDVDKAQGKELDEIGADINQRRGLANDEVYRMMIRSKRARASSDGTYNAIIDTMAKTLNCKPTELSFKSVIENGGDEPLALVVENIPIKVISDAQLTPSQLVQLIEQVAPGDVRVASANFTGTFRFSKVYDTPEYGEYGFDKGTLSLVLIPAQDTVLPI